MKTTITQLSLALAACLFSPLAPAQNLFVSDDGTNNGDGAIYEFTPAGVKSTFATGLYGPAGLAFDCRSNLFVGDATVIYKFSPQGAKSTFATGMYWPSGLAFDKADDLFEADAGSGAVLKIMPDGTSSVVTFAVSDPQGLAFDGGGNMYAADYLYGTVARFTTNGDQTSIGALNHPVSLAFDSAGNLFVAESWGGNRIDKITPDGTESLFASLPGELPMGLAFDGAGELFVACYQSGKIYKYTTNGVQSTFATGLTHPMYLAFRPAPAIDSVCVSGGCLRLTGKGGRMNATCFVLTSANVTLPVNNWTRVATNHFDGSGHFDTTSGMGPNLPAQFYILQLR